MVGAAQVLSCVAAPQPLLPVVQGTLTSSDGLAPDEIDAVLRSQECQDFLSRTSAVMERALGQAESLDIMVHHLAAKPLTPSAHMTRLARLLGVLCTARLTMAQSIKDRLTHLAATSCPKRCAE